MDRFLALGETWSHMASVSGFEPLCSAIAQVCGTGHISMIEVPNHIPEQRRLKRLLRRVGFSKNDVPLDGRASSPWISERHEWAARELIEVFGKAEVDWILLTVGENQLGIRFRGLPAGIRKRVVVCMHQPPSWHRLHWRDFTDYDGLGALVCLSLEQERFFSTITRTPIVTIRHGVCHDFFVPGPPKQTTRESRLLFVGQWLRDFETLTKAMQIIWKEQPEVTLDCVIPRTARDNQYLNRLAMDDRVRWHADIPAESLRTLYQESSLLFLPLVDATANNAVVEAMACGLPVVSTRVGGMADYLPEGGGELCHPGDADAHAKAVLEWLEAPERRAMALLISRKEVETNLTWNKTAENLVVKLTLQANHLQ